MAEVSRIVKPLVLFGFPVSCAGAIWLLFFSVEPPPGSLARVCWLSAVLCCLGSVVWTYSTIVAYLARRWDWSAGTCGWLTICFYGSSLLLWIFSNNPRAWSAVSPIFLLFVPSSYLIRRLAFPGLGAERRLK